MPSRLLREDGNSDGLAVVARASDPAAVILGIERPTPEWSAIRAGGHADRHVAVRSVFVRSAASFGRVVRCVFERDRHRLESSLTDAVGWRWCRPLADGDDGVTLDTADVSDDATDLPVPDITA